MILQPPADPQLSANEMFSFTGDILWFAGQRMFGLAESRVIRGCSLSTIVTANSHAARWPAASVAVQEIVVVPRGKADPDGGWQTTEAPGEAATLYWRMAEH